MQLRFSCFGWVLHVAKRTHKQLAVQPAEQQEPGVRYIDLGGRNGLEQLWIRGTCVSPSRNAVGQLIWTER